RGARRRRTLPRAGAPPHHARHPPRPDRRGRAGALPRQARPHAALLQDGLLRVLRRLGREPQQAGRQAARRVCLRARSRRRRRRQPPAEEKWRRVPLPWELFQPAMRIMAHCLLGPTNSDELKAQAARAAECLYWRAAETMDARALLATRSLVRLSQMTEEPIPEPSFSGGMENMAELEAMRANILSTKN
uniref:Uncharacterized protein n=1 Tax=Oryza brachyantha TaxID=4533 RepID=J3LSA8_ORYBR